MLNYTLQNNSLLELVQMGDKNAEEQLIKDNLNLVRSLVRRYSNSNCEFEDLFQAGCIGLLKAARNFDLTKNFAFSTYAVPVVLGEIRRYLRDDGPLKVSRSLRENAIKISREKQKLMKALDREPTTLELSKATGIELDELILSIDACSVPISLDKTTDDESSDRSTSIGELIGKDCFEEMIDSMALKDALTSLNQEDRKIITLRYFSGKTQSETAKMLNMTQVQVSRREKKILSALKENLTV